MSVIPVETRKQMAEPHGLSFTQVCCYCGLIHKDVEAGGVYYCPNVLCDGPGSFAFRSGLKSFRDLSEGRYPGLGGYTVDEDEYVKEAVKFAKNMESGPVREKIMECAAIRATN